MSVIEDVVSRIDDWVGKDVSVITLSGGLTNTNYKVVVDGKPYFVRVPGESTELLAIDRNNEYHNTKAAGEAGVAPKILHHLPEYNVMVIEFLDKITNFLFLFHKIEFHYLIRTLFITLFSIIQVILFHGDIMMVMEPKIQWTFHLVVENS